MPNLAAGAASRQPSRRPDATVLTFGPGRVDGLAGIMAVLGLPDQAAELVMTRLGTGARVVLRGPRGGEVRLVAGVR